MDLSKELLGIFNEGFDVETSPITDYEEIPDGIYDVAVEKFEVKESETSGNKRFQFTFKILTGDYKNKKHFGNLFLSEKTVKGSLKKLVKYAWSMGVDIVPEDLADLNDVVEKMKDVVGVQTTLTLKTSGTFKNWELSF